MAAVKLSGMFGAFKAQTMNRQAILGAMDSWAGTTLSRAIGNATSQNAMMGSYLRSGGFKAAGRFAAVTARPAMMRGAMIGAGLGATAAVGGDAMSGNLNFGTAGRALRGGIRGGLFGGAIGGIKGSVIGNSAVRSFHRGVMG
jgi:hypothetical protein